MLSGVRLSCYQEYEPPAKSITARVCAPPNITNLNTLTFSRETRLRWTTAKRQKAPQPRQQKQPQNQPRSARQKQVSFPDWRATP
ncbi:MAG TPA: hypothetical protein ENH62_04595 [Marinobacter sp.]|uniref:Uncharacterized protein n=1 Tax=Pseudomonas lactis TaxID=1615674 RepID=A0A7Y1LJ14_9PSED|nr:hypothetical protein [Pseudomonas lactis]HDZ37557.1 hypothetical protein [Marinobacter sp.]